MRSYEVTISSRGRVTIPVEIRRRLGLETRDKVTFLVSDGRVEIVPARFTLDTVFGSFSALTNQSPDFDVEIEEAMSDRADEVVKRLRQQ